MANSRSARKRIRANERKHVRNRAVRSTVRTKIAKARRELLAPEATSGPEELRLAISALDRAAEKGILHRNNASRRKSRLMSLAAKLSSAEGDQAAARSQAVGGEKGRSVRGKSGAAKAAAAKASPAKAAAKAPATKTPAKAAAAKPKTAPAKTTTARKKS